jgi:hypothetical protein
MKRVALTILLAVVGAGCARFTTIQSDTSYDTNGIPARTITTKVAAWTFFDANSALVKSKTINTDKSQSAELGGLNQNASSSNIVAAFQSMAQVAASLAK